VRKRRIRISEEGVVRIARRRSRFYPWARLVVIGLKADYVVLGVKPHLLRKIVVPRRAFLADDDWREFTSLALTDKLPD
jgi:hypothetical protein